MDFKTQKQSYCTPKLESLEGYGRLTAGPGLSFGALGNPLHGLETVIDPLQAVEQEFLEGK
jgi:hypothetical protein